MTSTATEGRPTKRKKKKKRTTLYTTTAPLEIISLFYRMGREAKEDKRSSELSLPDDTPIPDPVYKYTLSRVGTPEAYCSSLCSPAKSVNDSPYTYKPKKDSTIHDLAALDLEMMNSASWGFDDDEVNELLVDRSPSAVLVQNGDHYGESSSTTLLTPSPLLEETISKTLKKPKVNSTDFAYAEANEATRINIAELGSPEDIGKYLSSDKKEDEEIPFLRLMKDQLSAGRPKVVSSKPLLNSRLKKYERNKRKLSRVPWIEDSFVTGALLRAATSGSIRKSPTPVNEEKQGHWSVKVLPLSYFTSSESLAREEGKAEPSRLHLLKPSEK